jgi:hypothetical protein
MHTATRTHLCRIALAAGLLLPGLAGADVIAGTGQPGNANLGESQARRIALSSSLAGHILLLPYFNVQDGHATLLSISNFDTRNGKALKLRFRGAGNADVLFDMTVLLAPGDVWTALVRAGADGVAELVTEDASCTMPRLQSGQPQAFTMGRLHPLWPAAQRASNTREGYAEIITLADIPAAAVYGTAGTRESSLFANIRHGGAGVPPACGDAVLREALVQTNHTNEGATALLGFAGPTAGISGRWSILHVPRTTTFSGTMQALMAVDAAGAPARANFVLFPQTGESYSGAIDAVTADPLFRSEAFASKSTLGVTGRRVAGPAIVAAFFDLPDLSTPYSVGPAAPQAAQQQAAQASGALAATQLRNDYAVDAVISGKTDWTFSLPTQRYSVAMDYRTAPTQPRYTQVPPAGAQYFHDSNITVNPHQLDQSCVNFPSADFLDRSGRIKGPFTFPGASPVLTRFCGATSVLSIADPGSSVLAGEVARTDSLSHAFTSGWGEFRLRDDSSGVGVPVLGHSFMRATNPAAAPGISGTYGLVYEHALTR